MKVEVDENNIQYFLNEVFEKLKTGQTTELSFRSDFETLFDSFENILAVNEPKADENGKPDFKLLKKDNTDIIIAHAEMKDMGVDLDIVEKTDQFARYSSYEKLIITNNTEWRFYLNGTKQKTINIAEYDSGKKSIIRTFNEEPNNRCNQLANYLTDFFALPPEKIKNGKRLAEIMGLKARRIRDEARECIVDSGNEDLFGIYELIKKELIPDLYLEDFVDMYAQTIVYGLFIARYNDETGNSFSRTEARDLLKVSNKFLYSLFDSITSADRDMTMDDAIDSLCDVLKVSEVRKIVSEHLNIKSGAKDAKDPIIHFYEDFLKTYDPEMKKTRGIYYTPKPIVQYMIRFTDKILKKEFEIEDGISSNQKINYRGQTIPKVQILDPAVGTATFLNEIIKYIYNNKFKNNKGSWTSYVNNNLIPRLSGFELMMTPYTIAHLKLGMTSSELGCRSLDDSFHIYLANTLSEGIEKDIPSHSFGLQKAVEEESKKATEIKNEMPIMVVMGNPPYSGMSANNNEYANKLTEKYKIEPGGEQKLQEKNPKWINDDYVKFMAFAEKMIEQNKTGVISMITNHGYLDNPTFRGMRWRLLKTFDKIYILDLHGNTNKKETTPDGGKDENVFDIKQGVAIIIGVKTRTKLNLGKVYHAELLGTREHKFAELNADKPKFQKIKLDDKMLYFVPKNNEGKEEYKNGVSLNELMPINSVGIVTGKDDILINEDKKQLLESIANFKLNGKGKIFERLQMEKIDEGLVQEIAYRPFDKQKVYYSTGIIERAREKVMRNFLDDTANREREREREESRDDI